MRLGDGTYAYLFASSELRPSLASLLFCSLAIGHEPFHVSPKTNTQVSTLDKTFVVFSVTPPEGRSEFDITEFDITESDITNLI